MASFWINIYLSDWNNLDNSAGLLWPPVPTVLTDSIRNLYPMLFHRRAHPARASADQAIYTRRR